MGEKYEKGAKSPMAQAAKETFGKIKRSNMLGPWLAFLLLSLFVWMAFSDGDFSFLLTYASLTRCFAVTVLVTKLQQSKSAKGVSAKCLQCYAVVFVARLVSILRHEGYLPYDRSGDWVYHCIEVASFAAVVVALGLTHVTYASTYDVTADAFTIPPLPNALGALVIVVPAFVFAALFHPGLNKDFLSDTTWTFAMYVESFAILPQLYLFQKQSKQVATVDYLIGHFVAALGFSRLVEMGFWMNSFHELADRNGNRHVGVLVLGTQIVHLVIMCDFYYFYAVAVKKGLPIQLPSAGAAGMV
jgi:hypothetical protein